MTSSHGIPQLGFGTYGRREEAGISAILTALETGYRHIDTAQSYDTEYECGEAFRRSGLRRDEVFITTKIDTSNLEAGKLIPSLGGSLTALGLDQVDLALIHWPSPHDRVPLPVYLEQLAEAQARGLARLIGVSNFTIALLNEAERILGRGSITNNQVEINPHMQNKKLVNHCRDNGIAVTCYIPIAYGTLGSDPVIARIAERRGATAEQVALAFEMAKGLIAIPTSSKVDRIRSNFEATTLKLSPAEIAEIETLDRGHRRINPDWGPAWD